MRPRALTILMVVLSLLLSSCALFEQVDGSTWKGRVGQGEVTARVREAVVIFPDGVAPAGTGATVRLKRSAEAPAGTVSLSDVVEVSLDGGMQPSVPVTISVPVNADAAGAAQVAERYWLFLSSVGADGAESFVPGAYDASSGTFSVTVGHFSDFRVLGIDVGAALDEVRTAIMQGIGLEYPSPDCVGKPATVDGTKYEVVSAPGAHLCVEAGQGAVVVNAYPAIAMPYVITPSPRVDGATSATDATVGAAGVIAFANALGFIGTHSKAGVFPGGKASYTFKGAPQSIRFDLEQYPALLLMVILAKTLDTLGITAIDRLDDLQCLGDVAETNTQLTDGLNGESVGAFVKSFFSCAGTVADLNPLGRFLIAAVGTAPALLVTSIVGIINEFTGQARQHVELTVTPPKRLTDQQVLNSRLPANVCRTGDIGWEHASPIQLSDGKGVAKAADGSFGGAAVLESKVVGRADLDGNGQEEIVLSLMCTGSPPENCCAGRSSISTTVAVFAAGSGQPLRQVATSLMGGATPPGDEFGPAQRQIWSVSLQGTTIVTSESIIYWEGYTPAQVGGDPSKPVAVEYKLSRSAWVASRP